MTPIAAEIRNIISKTLASVANVSVQDQRVRSVIEVRIERIDHTIEHTLNHVNGYTTTARRWAKSILDTYPPSSY